MSLTNHANVIKNYVRMCRGMTYVITSKVVCN